MGGLVGAWAAGSRQAVGRGAEGGGPCWGGPGLVEVWGGTAAAGVWIGGLRHGCVCVRVGCSTKMCVRDTVTNDQRPTTPVGVCKLRGESSITF